MFSTDDTVLEGLWQLAIVFSEDFTSKAISGDLPVRVSYHVSQKKAVNELRRFMDSILFELTPEMMLSFPGLTELDYMSKATYIKKDATLLNLTELHKVIAYANGTYVWRFVIEKVDFSVDDQDTSDEEDES